MQMRCEKENGHRALVCAMYGFWRFNQRIIYGPNNVNIQCNICGGLIPHYCVDITAHTQTIWQQGQMHIKKVQHVYNYNHLCVT